MKFEPIHILTWVQNGAYVHYLLTEPVLLGVLDAELKSMLRLRGIAS